MAETMHRWTQGQPEGSEALLPAVRSAIVEAASSGLDRPDFVRGLIQAFESVGRSVEAAQCQRILSRLHLEARSDPPSGCEVERPSFGVRYCWEHWGGLAERYVSGSGTIPLALASPRPETRESLALPFAARELGSGYWFRVLDGTWPWEFVPESKLSYIWPPAPIWREGLSRDTVVRYLIDNGYWGREVEAEALADRFAEAGWTDLAWLR